MYLQDIPKRKLTQCDHAIIIRELLNHAHTATQAVGALQSYYPITHFSRLTTCCIDAGQYSFWFECSFPQDIMLTVNDVMEFVGLDSIRTYLNDYITEHMIHNAAAVLTVYAAETRIQIGDQYALTTAVSRQLWQSANEYYLACLKEEEKAEKH